MRPAGARTSAPTWRSRSLHYTDRSLQARFVGSADWRKVVTMATTPGMRSIGWRWIAAIWLTGGLFDATQTVGIMRAEGRHHAWLPLFGIEFLSWLPWALVTPVVIYLARRYPLVGDRGLRNIRIHLPMFAAICAIAEAWSAMF